MYRVYQQEKYFSKDWLREYAPEKDKLDESNINNMRSDAEMVQKSAKKTMNSNQNDLSISKASSGKNKAADHRDIKIEMAGDPDEESDGS